MNTCNNLEKILNKEIDFLGNNEITLNLDDDTVIIDEDTYENTNFIKMKILHNGNIANMNDLEILLENKPNIDVMIKQINMNKLSMGIIIRLNKLNICSSNDYIDFIKSQNPAKVSTKYTTLYEEEGQKAYDVSLCHTYLEYDNLSEYTITFRSDQHYLVLSYGDIRDKHCKIDLNNYKIVDYGKNNDDYKSIISTFCEPEIREQYSYYVNRILRLVNRESLILMFPEDLGHL